MQKFAVLGHPIGHSFSPVMHTASFRSIGFDGEYTKRDVPPETLAEALDALEAEGFRGLNLTIPHKQLAVPMMDELTPIARQVGAVNTVLFRDGKRYGHNTDAPGFLAAAKSELDFTPEGKAVAVIGCGGAGRAIAIALAHAGATALALIDIDTARTAALAEEIKSTTPAHAFVATHADLAAVDFIAQCSPSGLAVMPRPAALAKDFRAGQKLFDIVIPPHAPETPTMLEAQQAGVRCCNGTAMLAEQGALAFEFWTGLTPDRAAMRAALTQHP